MDWRRFCDTVDEVFQVKGLESSDPSEPTKEVNLQYNYGKAEVNEQQLAIVKNLQQRFHAFCVSTRLDIKCFFQDWDRHAHQKVSPKQFRQVLATVNFHLSNEEFDSVIQIYADNFEKQVRYNDFIKASFNQSSSPVVQNKVNKHTLK
jgi:Ca2+-binding EF-hand superfamily protein